MARVVCLKCDRCGFAISNDMNRITLWRHRLRFEKFDVCKVLGYDEPVYLCSNCAKKFREWLKEGQHGQDKR